ncbi:teichoic acid transport system ATP-binding protein [Paenibacillus sp. cl6col]|uniref:ABC transporter ATP-binding protein n=1 Tax=Paenibacillus alvei TaxID=44250 RepID=A0ABT4E7Z6_PAEAL|nr:MULTISPECIES: ABC transporter ATP-binding protein [Paenibacillus]MCY9528603.1 ABC transporter ATP-binding protein [Paenibacillus alvei]SDG22293.1 teichoic acid transport system ATP-binding protein [Paenibacillus sp. cl6col]
MGKSVLEVKSVTKIYKIYDNPSHRIKEAFNLTKKKYHKEFRAVDNVSFSVNKGQIVGILGKNGSGKSTLLKMVTGVITPTEGEIIRNGKIAALLELGAGFNPNLTGIENIYLNGTLMGYNKGEMDDKINDIISFADIGEFIHQPVKMYSSGMFARLAFSVAINVEPEILIVDEALSVGDIYFQAKCVTKMKELSKTCTILFVSHSMDTIKSFCDSAILLNEGKMIQYGSVKKVVQTYENMMNQEIADMKSVQSLDKFVKGGISDQNNTSLLYQEDINFTKMANEFRSGTGEARFIRADLLVNGKKTNTLSFGDKVTLRLVAQYYMDVDTEGTIGYMIRNHNGVDIFGMNIYNKARLLPPMRKNGILEVKFQFVNLLSESGKYTISIGLKPKPFEPLYFDSISIAAVFEVRKIENNYVPGLIFVDNEIESQVINI